MLGNVEMVRKWLFSFCWWKVARNGWKTPRKNEERRKSGLPCGKSEFFAKLMEMMKNSYEAEIEYDSPKILLEL